MPAAHQKMLPPEDAGSCADCCCLDPCRTKSAHHVGLASATGSYCGRRAMLNKLWFRELMRKWFLAKFDPPHPRNFSEPRAQKELRSWYLVYRWLIFLCWFAIIICSVFEIGSEEKLGTQFLWPIYLTNWDLVLGLIQAFLGVLIVTRRWRTQRTTPNFDSNVHLSYGKLERFYWFLYVVTSSLALGVTVTYWGLVHDPKIHHVDVLNILIHVMNSVLMLADLCVTGVPIRARSFWWCPLVTSFYIIFSIVYYEAGGVDKRGQHRIYNILDWQKPLRTLVVCAGGLTFLVLTHCLLYFVARFRDRAYDKRLATGTDGQATGNQVAAATTDSKQKKNESIV